MRFFAAENKLGFRNSWEVVAFRSRKERDHYVESVSWECFAVKKRDVTAYAANLSLREGRILKPQPFSGEKWAIDWGMEDQKVGVVFIAQPDDFTGFFQAEALF